MTTVSWPVREQPITHALWRGEFSGTDGIIDDTTGNAFALALSSTSDVATLAAGGRFRLRGFVLEVSEAHTLTLPAVASGGTAVTYVVGLRYDTANEASAGGPLAVFSAVKGSFVSSESVAQLWEVTRSAGKVLSASTVVDQRAWNGGTYYGGAGAAAVGTWPVGAHLITADGTERIRVRSGVSGGLATGTAWASLTDPTWTTLTLRSGFTSHATTPQYTRIGNQVWLRGGIQRTNGKQLAAGNITVSLATLPTGYRPTSLQRFPAAASYEGIALGGRIAVGSDGVIDFLAPNDDCVWVCLDGLTFFVPASTSPQVYP